MRCPPVRGVGDGFGGRYVVVISREAVTQQIQISPTRRLVVTTGWCKPCGICMEICPRNVLETEEVTGKVILAAPEACTGCGLCELFCPDYVFTVKEEESASV